MITRRELLGSMAGAACAARAAERRPNLLFLLGDDHRHDVLGAAGNRLAETPHLDRIAAEGTRFTHHYVNYPMCTPSRQSVFTGLLPHASGVSVLTTPLSEERRTLAEQLKSAGYRTAAMGKMHFMRKPEDGMHGLDLALVDGAADAAARKAASGRKPSAELKTKPQWRPFRDPARVWLNADGLPYGLYDQDMTGSYIARRAAEYLEQNRDQPFALWVSFKEPHSPFDFPLEDRGHFDPRRFPLPRIGPQDASQIPLIFRDLSEEDRRGIAAAYYTSVRFLDRNIGRVMAALRQNGLDRNTLVVYWGDNGYSLGEHGRFEKHCFYEHCMRVPLLARMPGRVRAGARVDALTESVDIPATILDALGVEPMPGMHGRSLAPYLEGRRPPQPRDHVFSEYLHNEEACIRTARWKLIYCSGRRKRDDGYETAEPTPGRYLRLFDVRKDPGEFEDVSARHRPVVQDLLGLMLRRFRDTHPEAGQEPRGGVEDSLDWYLRPRDARA